LWTMYEHARLYMTISDNVEREVSQALANEPEGEIKKGTDEVLAKAARWAHQDLKHLHEALGTDHEPDDSGGDSVQVGDPEHSLEYLEGHAATDVYRIDHNSARRIPEVRAEAENVRQALRQRIPDEIRSLPDQMRQKGREQPSPVVQDYLDAFANKLDCFIQRAEGGENE